MLYLISFLEVTPKLGHKPQPSRRVVSADSSTAAVAKFITEGKPKNLSSVTCEYIHGAVIE